jgi:hypothetical protein
MTEHEQDFLRYLEDLQHTTDCMQELTELTQQMIEQTSLHFIRNHSNLDHIKNKASENLHPYFVGNISLLQVKSSIMADIIFLSSAVTTMNKVHRYGL